jgi:hypothetical protein
MAEKKEKKIDLSLIVACYNEGEHLHKSLPILIDFLNEIKITYELIIIDDCSKDNTREIINQIAKGYSSKKMRIVFHNLNVGRGGTVTEGMMIANGKYTGFLDIDLETPPWYILPALYSLKNGYDLVCAHRIYKSNIKTFIREFLSRSYNKLMKFMLGVSFEDSEAGFKFFNTEEIKPVLRQVKNKHWFFDTEIMVRSYYAGLKIKEIPTLFLRKEDKTSTVKIFRDSIDYFKNLKSFKPIARDLRKKWELQKR